MHMRQLSIVAVGKRAGTANETELTYLWYLSFYNAIGCLTIRIWTKLCAPALLSNLMNRNTLSYRCISDGWRRTSNSVWTPFMKITPLRGDAEEWRAPVSRTWWFHWAKRSPIGTFYGQFLGLLQTPGPSPTSSWTSTTLQEWNLQSTSSTFFLAEHKSSPSPCRSLSTP